MENFTPWLSLAGGALIGLSATLMLLLHGRITGISGIFAGAVSPWAEKAERPTRWVFLAGLIAGGFLLQQLMPGAFTLPPGRSLLVVVAAGLLVGVGTRLGGGCTSGHGVCGLSRFSPRSLVATITFISAGALIVALMGGAP